MMRSPSRGGFRHTELRVVLLRSYTRSGRRAKGPQKNNLSKCRVILREPRRLKNPLGVREILRSLGLPQDDMNRLEFRKIFIREP